MPVLDLRDPADRTRLKPLAYREVQSIMLAPRDKLLRARVIAGIRREEGEDRLRQAPMDEKDTRRLQRRGWTRGLTAGFMLNGLIQCWNEGLPRSIANAIKYVQHEIPSEPGGGHRQNQSPNDVDHNVVRSPRKLKSALEHFKPVAHLWGAYIYMLQIAQWKAEELVGGEISNNRDNVLLRLERDQVGGLVGLDRLPEFIGYANAILDLARKALPSSSTKFVLINNPWTIVLPENLMATKQVTVMPILPGLKDAITRSDPSND